MSMHLCTMWDPHCGLLCYIIDPLMNCYKCWLQCQLCHNSHHSHRNMYGSDPSYLGTTTWTV